MTELHKVYTVGYTGKKLDDLVTVRLKLNAALVDVRYKANSKIPHWRGGALSNAMGGTGHYAHLPDLGNTNYRNAKLNMNNKNWGGVRGTDIVFASLEAGLASLQFILIDRPVILLCVCLSLQSCHRVHIGQEMKDRGYEVIHLEQKEIDDILGKPPVPTQGRLF